jgi:hypothetical protein
VDTLRDLARVDPWRESLERSRARRCKLPSRSIEPNRLRSPALARRWMTVLLSAGGVLTFALLAATRPSISDGLGTQASARGAHTDASRVAAGSPAAGSGHAAGGSARVGVSRTCRPADSSKGYVNPLAYATVTPRRIDQGVDYAGSGTLTAIGVGRITYLATVNTGWPGAFIEYQLLGGPDYGCYVYYAEGVTPAPGLHVGEIVRAGQAVAILIPDYSSGIEIGWGAGDGTKSYAAEISDWSATNEANNIPAAAGKIFSALIASLGGPPGKFEGQRTRAPATALIASR